MTKLTLGYMKKLNEKFLHRNYFLKKEFLNYLFEKKESNQFIFNVLKF